MKTLKDIELDKYSYPTKILKELAIKWVKEELESNELEIVERNKNKHFGEFKDE